MENKEIDLEKFKLQVRGRPYNSLIEYHIKKQNSHELNKGIQGTILLLSQEMKNVAEIVIDFWNSRAQDKNFWKKDCAEIFEEIIWETQIILDKRAIHGDSESLFNIFQIVTLNFAYMASTKQKLRKFAGIKKGWFS